MPSSNTEAQAKRIQYVRSEQWKKDQENIKEEIDRAAENAMRQSVLRYYWNIILYANAGLQKALDAQSERDKETIQRMSEEMKAVGGGPVVGEPK